MGNVRRRDKFESVDWANLAQSYRLMAGVMLTPKSRDRLLRMAEKLESRSGTKGKARDGTGA